MPHSLAMVFSILLQVVLLGIGKTLLSLVMPLYFSMIRLGTSNRRIFDSVLVFFSGNNPKVAVKECLQVVFREALDIGVRQTCKGGEQE